MQARTPLIVAASALTAVFVLSLFVAPERAACTAKDGNGAPASEATASTAPALRLATSTNEPTTRNATASPVAESAASVDEPLADVDVIHAGTSLPVPDATVWWWPASTTSNESTFQEWLRRSELEQHLDDALQARADGAGRARLPNVERGGLVAAASGELWGFALFAPGASEPRSVALATDANIRVRVVDEQGEPVAGVIVALRERRLGACFDHLTALTNGSDGEAVLRHTSRVFGAQPESNPNLLVGVAGLFDPPLERELDAQGEAELVTLAMEPFGSCEVRIVEADDRPVGGALDARVRFADVESSSESISSRTGENVVFERVEIGHELIATVTREATGELAEIRARGPRVAGERVQVRVPVGGGLAIVRGRLVDSSGAPASAASARVRIEHESNANAERSWSVLTDADGRFHVEVEPYDDVERATLAVARVSADGAALAVARCALPRELAAGTYDLGELVLADVPIVAAGRVVGRDGRAIAGAVVEASRCATPGEIPGESLDAAFAIGLCDANGAFEIRAEHACGELTLCAHAKGLVGSAISVNNGAREVELVLEAAAACEGTVLLDPTLSSAVVLVQAALDGDEPSHGPIATTTVGRDGAFALRDLRPGTYALSIVYAATASELASARDVRLVGGETSRDPRLDPLDLRDRHRLIELELVDEHGESVNGARAFSRASDRADAPWSYSGRETGRLALLSDGHPLDVTIAAPGFLRCELERVEASRRVVLRRAAKLRLQLPRQIALPEFPLRLMAVLTPCETGPSCGFADSMSVDFNSRGEIVCESAFTGALRVELVLARRGSSGSGAVYGLESPSSRVIHVADHALEQAFEIAVDPTRLEQARQTLDVGD